MGLIAVRRVRLVAHSGPEFWRSAHFQRALIIVLFSQRPKPATGLRELAGQNEQIQQIGHDRLGSRMAQDIGADQNDEPAGLS